MFSSKIFVIFPDLTLSVSVFLNLVMPIVSFVVYWLGSEKTEKVIKTWKKERAFALYDSGYHSYFAISAHSLSNSSEFDVDEGATKAKIKSAFAKSLKSKKMNKKVLGEVY